MHLFKKNPTFAEHLRTWDDAGTVKVKKATTSKLANKGVQCMFVGYTLNHVDNCYCMLNLSTMRVMISRDIVWVRRMYFNPPSIFRHPAIEIDNHEIVEKEAGESIDAEESIEAGESTCTDSDDKNFNTNVEDDEPVHKKK
eukprot:12177039-Ditylum_brightwellii.AAC.1